jgi:holo-[acyl-carrier protein] synthase
MEDGGARHNPAPPPYPSPTVPAPVLAFVPYGDIHSLDDLVAPARPDDVFTAAERRHCAASSSLARWAGRLAAKRAVLQCLGLSPDTDHRDVEVVPGPHEGQALPHLCALGHRPVAHLHGAAADACGVLGLSGVDLSISHDGGLAVALADPQVQDGVREPSK